MVRLLGGENKQYDNYTAIQLVVVSNIEDEERGGGCGGESNNDSFSFDDGIK